MEAIRNVIAGSKKTIPEEPKAAPPKKKRNDCDRITYMSITKYNVTKSGHVDYIVELRKGGMSWQVQRRYTQFKKLHADLTSLCPLTTPYHCEYGVIPVLCGSSWTEVTNQSAELIEKRRGFLEIYIEQLLVSKNKFYQSRTALYAFLHDDELPVSSKPGSTPFPGLGAAGGKVPEEVASPVSGDAASASFIPIASAGVQQPSSDFQIATKTVSETIAVPLPAQDLGNPSCPSVPAPSFMNLLQSEDIEGHSPNSSPTALLLTQWRKCTNCKLTEPCKQEYDKGECSKCKSEGTWMLVDEAEVDTDDKTATAANRTITAAEDIRPEWMKDTNVSKCTLCNAKFSFFLRKHHCRRCGGIFCGYCSLFTAKLPELSYDTEVRVCKDCKQTIVSEPSATLSPREKRESSESSSHSHDDCGHHNSQQGSLLASMKNLGTADFELITTLGKGTFGKVMKVAHKKTGEVYAMKVLSKKVVHKRRMVDYIREEKNILSKIPSHPFIVPLYAAFQTDHHLYLLLEFLPGGELYSHIYSQGRFGEVDARFYTAEIVLAVEHLHSRDIVHRDIKPENIVIDRCGHARLTDFGLAKADFSKSTRRSFVGSAEYLAPETIKGDTQSSAVDWWSVGVLLYEMLCGSAPFNGTNNNDVYQQILHKNLTFANMRPHTASILKGLLDREVPRRLSSAAVVKSHEFFSTIDWEMLLARKVKPPFVPDLQHNDTRYFSKEFTHEWATVDGETSGKSTLDLLSTKFDNFPVERSSGKIKLPIRDNRLGAAFGQEYEAGTPGDNLFIAKSLTIGSFNNMPTTIDIPDVKDAFFGVWTLKSLELITESGKVSYPWGSEVAGQAVYTKNGQFSLQLTTSRSARSRFEDTDYQKVTRDEMADAYLGYVASFGMFTHKDGNKYITHYCVGSLCPNWAESEQKRYFKFVDNSGRPHRDYLILTTGSIGVDGMTARTVMKFQRASDVPTLPEFVERRLLREAAIQKKKEQQQQQQQQDKSSDKIPISAGG